MEKFRSKIKDAFKLMVTKPLWVVGENTPIDKVIEKAVSRPYHESVIVTSKDGNIVGVVPFTRLLGIVYAERRLGKKMEKRVKDIMINPIVVSEDNRLLTAVEFMMLQQVYELPVVSEDVLSKNDLKESDVIGTLTYLEILRHSIGKPMVEKIAKNLEELKVRDAYRTITLQPLFLEPEASIKELIEFITLSPDHKATFIIDVKKKLIGIVPNQLILESIKGSILAGEPIVKTVKEVMMPPISVTEEWNLKDAIEQMLTSRIFELPVVNLKGKIKGTLTDVEIFKHVGMNIFK